MECTRIKNRLVSLHEKMKTHRLIKALKMNDMYYVSEKFNLADIYHLRSVDHELWEKTLVELEHFNLLNLKSKDIIKVAFVLYSASMWSCDILYNLFSENSRFDPYIVVSRYDLDVNQSDFPTYKKSLAALQKSGFKVISISENTPKDACYKAIGSPDIVIYLTPYSCLYPIGQNEVYMPAKTLCIYIPYSYMLISADGKFDSPGMTVSWRHFSDSQLYRNMLIRHSSDYEKNTFFVGYPKMDTFYEASEKEKKEVWKLPNGDSAKCIIYAPHHSLPSSKTCTARFSTFIDNYMDILECARTHQTTTSWIIKPHPNLKMTVLETGLFSTEYEYEEYLEKWNSLPNAKVVEESTYSDIFKTSDAMICDSVSFLAEYQFTGKPLLLLTRPDNNFNEFGLKISEQLYKVSGTDIDGINHFIENVVLKGHDSMRERRREFFKENLDYRVGGKPSASQQIYDHIVDAISKA